MKYLSFLNWFNKHRRITIAIVAVLFILVMLFRPKPPKPIPTETISKGTIAQTVSATGSIYSENSVSLSFLSGGKLVYLGVKKGDSVQKGQIIATLDQRSAQVSLQNALIDYNKQRNTFDATQENYGDRKPKDALNETMRNILENNQYDLNKAINSVELQSLAKEQSVLVSPISGVVVKADITSAGLNIGPTTIFSIADTTNMLFRADVDEADMGKIKQGQEMKITLDAYPDEDLSIPIDMIDYASHLTSTGGTAYTVEGKLIQKNNEYRIGLNGDVEITVAKVSNILTVPLSSLIDDTHVYVQDGKVFKRRTIKLGIQSDTSGEVLSGLSLGEKVALTPDDVEKQFPKLKSE